jgi:phosphatidylinositol alpha-1,6-mannosyltransferase
VSKPGALLLSRNLPPLRGGMERLNWHLAEELAGEFDLTVCGPAGCAAQLPFARVVREAPLRPLSRFLIRNLIDAIRMARRHTPRIIVCGSGLTVPAGLLAARFCGAPVMAYLHGLDIIAEHWLYRLVWRRSLRFVDLALVNSRHTAVLAQRAGVPAGRIRLLHPGVSPPFERHGAAEEFRRHFDLGQRPLLLSVGRLTRRKGLVEFVERCLPIILARYPDLLLVVIGEEATDALSGGPRDQRRRILDAAGRAGASGAIRLLGGQPDEFVAAAFRAASALVFPILELPGDVEGFGMVAVEAAAHGLPTVAFAVGGVTDAVAEGISGCLIAPGDYPAMAHALIALLAEDRAASPAEMRAARERRIAFSRAFEWANFGQQLRAIASSAVPA